LNNGIHRLIPEIAGHLLNFLYCCQELGTTLLLHDICVPPLNRGNVCKDSGGAHQSNRFDGTTGFFIGVVGELSSKSTDTIQLWYLDKMDKLQEPGPNLIVGILTGRRVGKMCRRLDFNEEKRGVKIQWLNDIGDHKTDGAGAACLSLSSDILGCNCELSGGKAFITAVCISLVTPKIPTHSGLPKIEAGFIVKSRDKSSEIGLSCETGVME
jgi:hypothetical protein